MGWPWAVDRDARGIWLSGPHHPDEDICLQGTENPKFPQGPSWHVASQEVKPLETCTGQGKGIESSQGPATSTVGTSSVCAH